MHPNYQYFLPQHRLSRIAGVLTNSQKPWLKNFLIRRAQKAFDISLREAVQEDPTAYLSFNDFFTRALKPSARPIDPDPTHLVSPADGRVLAWGTLAHQRLLQAKGRYYALPDLVQDRKLAHQLSNGSFVTLYLSPQDYHRVHLPYPGVLTDIRYIPGQLFSVSPRSAASIPKLFSRNERVIFRFETSCGPLVVIMVGALLVGSIETPWHGIITPPQQGLRDLNLKNPKELLHKGAELGRFRFGSTAIVLAPPGALTLSPHLSLDGFVRMGECIATLSEKNDSF